MDNVTNIQNWFRQNRDNFSIKMNGFSNPPILSYISLLPLIDSNGLVLDVGSGNGMLLKFILDFSNHNLIPYGIDLNEDAINMTKQVVLPEFSNNFIIGDIDKCLPLNQIFDIIICNPFHSKKSFDVLINTYLSMLRKNGKIVIRVHDDVLVKENLIRVDEKWNSFQIPIRLSRGADVTYGVILK